VSSIAERRASGFGVGRRLRLAVIGLGVAVSVGSLPGEAQQVAKTGRVGFVGLNPAVTRERAAFLQGMRDLGYVEAAMS
jgi:hypothetical protein